MGLAGMGGRNQVVFVGPRFKVKGAAGGLWPLDKAVLRHDPGLRGKAT